MEINQSCNLCKVRLLADEMYKHM